MSPETMLQVLIPEVATLLDARELHHAGDTWQFELREGLTVSLEYDANFERIVITHEIGALPPDAGVPVYAMLLQYNRLWRETGGTRMAFDGPEGPVVLMMELGVNGLHATLVCDVVQGMLAIAPVWREILGQTPDVPTQVEPWQSGEDSSLYRADRA